MRAITPTPSITTRRDSDEVPSCYTSLSQHFVQTSYNIFAKTFKKTLPLKYKLTLDLHFANNITINKKTFSARMYKAFELRLRVKNGCQFSWTQISRCINADLSSFRLNLSFYLTLEISQIIVIELSSEALIFNI